MTTNNPPFQTITNKKYKIPFKGDNLELELVWRLCFGLMEVDQTFQKLAMSNSPDSFMSMGEIQKYSVQIQKYLNAFNINQTHQNILLNAYTTKDTNTTNSHRDQYMEIAMNPMLNKKDFQNQTIKLVFGESFYSVK